MEEHHKSLRQKIESLDWETRKHKPYGTKKKDVLFGIYLSAILLWGLLIAYLQPDTDFLGWIILIVPILVFLISTLSLDSLSVLVESNMFKFSSLSVGLLIILPLLTFITRDFKGDKRTMIQIVLLAITFGLLSMIDVWVAEKWISVVKHIKSIFQIVSLTLVLFALYLYYSSMGALPW